MTPLYHQAFPTGHSRFLTLTPVEIMLYVGLPGLYPLPVLWRMAPILTLTLTLTVTVIVTVTVTVTVTLTLNQVLWRMAQLRSWGCVPAIALCVVALPLGFCAHAAERLVADLHCEPTSLLTQPTACFHVATALAITAAYVHALALEEKI